jgi:hypothetical protein
MDKTYWKKGYRDYHLRTRTAWRNAMRCAANPENVDRYIEALTAQLDAVSKCLNDTPAGTGNFQRSTGSMPVSLFARSDFVRG